MGNQIFELRSRYPQLLSDGRDVSGAEAADLTSITTRIEPVRKSAD